jgi:squalene synthase HpnC
MVMAAEGPVAPLSLAAAYAACQQLAATHYENFPVASRLVPARLRKHIAAVYAFARVADDYADQPGPTTPQRLALLDAWHRSLHAGTVAPGTAAPAHPGTLAPGTFVFPALHDTINQFDLPLSLFDDLLSAFRQDVTTSRYASWEEVFDYCRRSANPVGRLVLRLSGYKDDSLDRSSDAVCTALQLANFWQDLAIDWARGRLYVPAEEWQHAGARLESLDACAMTPEWRAAMRACVDRARSTFLRGRPVCDGVSGRLRYQLRATWLGGMRILERLDRAGYDAFTRRPTLGARDAVVIGWKTLAWT